MKVKVLKAYLEVKKLYDIIEEKSGKQKKRV